MDEVKESLLCRVCLKQFSSSSTRNRHMRKIHNEEPVPTTRNTLHMKCPLCPGEEKTSLGSHDDLLNHLRKLHSLNITWRSADNRGINYAQQRTSTNASNEKYIYYKCNRSNTTGFTSQCKERSMKAGGSIKIPGICPSRIAVKFSSSGLTVKYVETHVGHDDDLRSKRLTKDQQELISSKLVAGVTKERILDDARIIKNNQIERINILTRGDLAYIVRKFNINKQRDADDMIATALKVKEWNATGENNVFLFKQIGENHPELKTEDFALGFMNLNMERKLKDFKKIICIDGTHGTNARNWDLTTVLVKDENNTGFPVAFLISNRVDQKIQTIFFRYLRMRIGAGLKCDYIMTDDDIKYYNAWCETMVDDKKPRRLLCTWHVIKNWNIQGRNKLKKIENKKEMKIRMRGILKEMDITKFNQLKDIYFKHLEDEGENEFLKYLQNHYFQSIDRIMMWAHCHRLNVGINTNMAIESLNKVIKYNKMKGNQNIRIEKLLDLLEELVNDRMWKKIVNVERPNANSYQSRVNREAHAKAEKLAGKVVCLDSGEYKVFSSSVRDKFYIVQYNEICDSDCRTMYCHKCKICIHNFKCQCAEYSVKTALCKHIHAVALIETGSDYVAGPDISHGHEELCISEPSTSRANYQLDIENFIKESKECQNTPDSIDSRQKHEELAHLMKNLCSYIEYG